MKLSRPTIPARKGALVALGAAILLPTLLLAESQRDELNGLFVFGAGEPVRVEEVNENFQVLGEHVTLYESAMEVDPETRQVTVLKANAPDEDMTFSVEGPSRFNQDVKLRISESSEANGAQIYSAQIYAEDTDASLSLGAGGSAGDVVITPEGRVGIGTSDPGTFLDIRSPSVGSGIIIGRDHACGYCGVGRISFERHTSNDSSYAGELAAIVGRGDYDESGGGMLDFQINDDAGAGLQSKMVIDSEGRVGIGLKEPNMSGYSAHGIHLSHESNTGIVFEKEGQSMSAIHHWSGENLDFLVSNDATLSESDVHVSITPEGHVGIGHRSPSYPLDVNGLVRADNISVSSDRRLKKDILNLTDATEGIQCLQGVTYTLRDPEASQDLQLGLIAQEVERCFPEVVHTDAQGMKSVSYARLVAPLIEATKAQQADLERQAQAIKELRRDLDALRDQLGAHRPQ